MLWSKEQRKKESWRLTDTSARPADAWITTAALYFIGVLFCCIACLEVSSASRNPYYCIVGHKHDA